MESRLLCWAAICLLVAVSVSSGQTGAGVSQVPKHRVTKKGQAVALRCDPISGHAGLYWYRQTRGQSLVLLTYFQDENEADKSGMPDDRFSAERPKGASSTLRIQPVEPGDSAVYLCASSLGISIGPGPNELHFGQGTRLTVLDDLSKVTPPKVAVFEPSEAEISRTQKATLVCLATNFYPDHVELSWWVNGKEARSGVSTDPQPQKGCTGVSDSTYCMSSLLRVSAAFWHNPRNHFRCQVQFYGLSAEDEDQWDEENNGPLPVTQNISAEAWGHADCGLTSVSYQQGVLSATVLYEVLLGKAALYAVLVSALVLVAMVKKKDS